jgi:hypothetical protein
MEASVRIYVTPAADPMYKIPLDLYVTSGSMVGRKGAEVDAVADRYHEKQPLPCNKTETTAS